MADPAGAPAPAPAPGSDVDLGGFADQLDDVLNKQMAVNGITEGFKFASSVENSRFQATLGAYQKIDQGAQKL